MRSVERPAISAAIAEARDKGDLSENAEYDAAREAQGMLEMRIAQMEHTLSKARIIDESKIDTSKVQILSRVKLLNHHDRIRERGKPARGQAGHRHADSQGAARPQSRRHGRGIGSGGHAQTRNPQHLDLIRRRSARQARRHAAARAPHSAAASDPDKTIAPASTIEAGAISLPHSGRRHRFGCGSIPAEILERFGLTRGHIARYT